MGIPKGTRLTENPKNTTFKVRMDEEIARKLEIVADKTAQSKADVIRHGIEIQYSDLQNKE